MKKFLMEICQQYRDCVFDVSFVLHFWGDSDVSITVTPVF